MLAKAGGLPWAYRPEKFDDWGTIRTAPDAEGMSWPICQARLPYSAEEALAEHRRNGTDPWEDTARLIVAAVNFVARNIDRIAALSPGQEKR